MRRLLLTALTTALLVPPGHAAADVLRESSEKVLDPTGLSGVRIENSRGRVDVQPSLDGRIHVIALKEVRAASADERRRRADETHVTAGTENGVFAVHVDYAGSGSVHVEVWNLFGGFELPRCEVKLTVEVPPRLAVSVETASGDVSCAGMTGPQNITASSGDIDIREVSGPLMINTSSGDLRATGLAAARIRTSSGDVQIEHARGPVEIHTHSGDVEVRAASDSLAITTGSGDVVVGESARGLHVQTSSGEIQVKGASGAVRLSTMSGDVTASLHGTLASVEVSASSGEIVARFDRDASLRLDVRTSSGEVEAGLPLRVLSADRHRLNATCGTGQTPVVLRSSSGDIHVTDGGR
ncbi:MAG: DUF4097 family beta strand repeat protein [Candidatus Eisenbacteria bacterium]|nr:DUF4097 family beta strand repeat protein [Candidatus Eisenbacteria bacterium]